MLGLVSIGFYGIQIQGRADSLASRTTNTCSNGVHLKLVAKKCESASEFEFSPDGALFITSEITGIITVWNFEHFACIYQLSCEPDVAGLCFSPDHGRFYDLSGSACIVWEPNVLIRLTKIDERASEKESEARSTTQTSSASEVWAETADLVTAPAANSEQSLYCAGNEVGVLELFDVLGSNMETYRSRRFLTIELSSVSVAISLPTPRSVVR